MESPMKNLVFIVVIMALSGIIIALVVNCSGVMLFGKGPCRMPPVNTISDSGDIIWDCGEHDVDCFRDTGFIGTVRGPCYYEGVMCESRRDEDTTRCKSKYGDWGKMYSHSTSGCYFD